MKSLLALVEDLNQAALASGMAHGARGVSVTDRRARDAAECAAVFAVQDRIEAIIEAGPDREILALIEGDES